MIKKIIHFLAKNGIYLTVFVVFVLFSLRVDPISRNDSHFYRMILAIFSIVIILAYIYFKRENAEFSFPWLKKKQRTSEKVFFTIVLIMVIFGIFNYYQYDKKVFLGVGDYSDVTFYYVNSKYFDELGYFALYPAMLIADAENNNRLNYIATYRDLHTYEIVGREIAFTDVDSVKSKFSSERWEQFKHDIDFLVQKNIAGGWRYFFIDHGYNPPPTWTVVGGFLSSLVPVEKLKWITSVDIILILIMFFFITRAFKIETTFIAMLFFLVTFSGRWPILGQALLRFDWLAALVVAVCMLKLGKHGWAGALMMYASLNRVFPTIFFFPYGVVVLYHLYKNRRFAKQHVNFIVGAITVFILLVGSALIFEGSQSFLESKDNLLMHGGPASYSSHRVGLADALFFRFETTRAEMNENGGITGKARQIEGIMLLLYVIGAASLALIFLYIIITRKKVYELIVLSAIPLFILVTPQINYYNFRILLVIWHMLDISKLRNKIGLVLLFFIEVVTQYIKVLGYERYTITCTTSLGLVVYFVFIIAILIVEVIRRLSDNQFEFIR